MSEPKKLTFDEWFSRRIASNEQDAYDTWHARDTEVAALRAQVDELVATAHTLFKCVRLAHEQVSNQKFEDCTNSACEVARAAIQHVEEGK